MKRHHKQLSLEEREEIAILKAKGWRIREIAREMGRHHTTILREFRRNAAPLKTGYYLPSKAHERAARRKARAGRRLRKLRKRELREYVEAMLLDDWSPEQIAGRIRKDLPGHSISHKAIYQWIYEEKRYLIRWLAKHHRERWPRGHSRKHRTSLIPNRTPLTERPPSVNTRRMFGHWESDSVVSKTDKAVLNVLVERKSRLVHITKMQDHTAHSTRSAIEQRLAALLHEARRSITYDNGHENVEHERINQRLGMQSYFCEPYRSWEKGTIENTVGLIRRYIPKGTAIGPLRSQFLKRIEAKLNARPRKCLQFRTPSEMFEKFSGAFPR